jgi:hypothetical protein
MAGPAEDPPKRNTEAGLEEASLEATGLEETIPEETGLENKEAGLEETGLEETGPPTGGFGQRFPPAIPRPTSPEEVSATGTVGGHEAEFQRGTCQNTEAQLGHPTSLSRNFG